MTPLQTQLLHLAQKKANLNDRQYRMLLRHVADVASSKQLTNTTFEDVMATLEERGFRHAGKPDDYWRNKVQLRGSFGGERVTHKIHALIQGTKYTLPGLCDRFSHGRTREVSKLNGPESYALIEMLKSVVVRPSRLPLQSAGQTPSPQQQNSLFANAGETPAPQKPVTEDPRHAPPAMSAQAIATAPHSGLSTQDSALSTALDEAGREDVPF